MEGKEEHQQQHQSPPSPQQQKLQQRAAHFEALLLDALAENTRLRGQFDIFEEDVMRLMQAYYQPVGVHVTAEVQTEPWPPVSRPALPSAADHALQISALLGRVDILPNQEKDATPKDARLEMLGADSASISKTTALLADKYHDQRRPERKCADATQPMRTTEQTEPKEHYQMAYFGIPGSLRVQHMADQPAAAQAHKSGDLSSRQPTPIFSTPPLRVQGDVGFKEGTEFSVVASSASRPAPEDKQYQAKDMMSALQVQLVSRDALQTEQLLYAASPCSTPWEQQEQAGECTTSPIEGPQHHTVHLQDHLEQAHTQLRQTADEARVSEEEWRIRHKELLLLLAEERRDHVHALQQLQVSSETRQQDARQQASAQSEQLQQCLKGLQDQTARFETQAVAQKQELQSQQCRAAELETALHQLRWELSHQQQRSQRQQAAAEYTHEQQQLAQEELGRLRAKLSQQQAHFQEKEIERSRLSAELSLGQVHAQETDAELERLRVELSLQQAHAQAKTDTELPCCQHLQLETAVAHQELVAEQNLWLRRMHLKDNELAGQKAMIETLEQERARDTERLMNLQTQLQACNAQLVAAQHQATTAKRQQLTTDSKYTHLTAKTAQLQARLSAAEQAQGVLRSELAEAEHTLLRTTHSRTTRKGLGTERGVQTHLQETPPQLMDQSSQTDTSELSFGWQQAADRTSEQSHADDLQQMWPCRSRDALAHLAKERNTRQTLETKLTMQHAAWQEQQITVSLRTQLFAKDQQCRQLLSELASLQDSPKQDARTTDAELLRSFASRLCQQLLPEISLLTVACETFPVFESMLEAMITKVGQLQAAADNWQHKTEVLQQRVDELRASEATSEHTLTQVRHDYECLLAKNRTGERKMQQSQRQAELATTECERLRAEHSELHSLLAYPPASPEGVRSPDKKTPIVMTASTLPSPSRARSPTITKVQAEAVQLRRQLRLVQEERLAAEEQARVAIMDADSIRYEVGLLSDELENKIARVELLELEVQRYADAQAAANKEQPKGMEASAGTLATVDAVPATGLRAFLPTPPFSLHEQEVYEPGAAKALIHKMQERYLRTLFNE